MEKDLKDLLIDELHDILSAEEQIVKALPDMVKAAESPDLKNAFESHLKETKGQIKRLEKIFKLLKVSREEKFCKATKGLIDECKDVLKDFKTKSPIRDSALISKAQRIEHYEISAYGTVCTFAKELKESAVVSLLKETLSEEENADKKLSKIAEGGFFSAGINQLANTHSEDEPRSESPKKRSSISKPKEIVSKIIDSFSGDSKTHSTKKTKTLSHKTTLSPKKKTSTSETSKKESSKKESSEKESSKKNTNAKSDAPKTAASKSNLTKKIAPKKVSPKSVAPKKVESKNVEAKNKASPKK